MSRNIAKFYALILVLAAALPWMRTANAVPAYARETGMPCTSCHIGTDSVPNFTRTGRLFAMRSYNVPYVREKMRYEGQTLDNNKQYGGDYLSLNWMDYFSARLISDLASGGRRIDGSDQDVTSRPLARMALFYTGQITDWLGLWTEIGYLGNNSLSSVTTGQAGPTGLNLFAYDEYRLSATWDYGKGSFWGISLGNEHPNVVGQFNFPLPLPDLWFMGQGGSGRSKDISNLSVQTFWNDRLWLQGAIVTGGDNNNWDNGSNQYINVAYDFFRKTSNDLWLVFEYYRGDDFPSIMTPTKNSFICPGACPPGIVDTNFSITNTPGFTPGPIVNAPVLKVDDFDSYKISAQWAVADRGVNTWYAGLMLHEMKENFVAGGNVKHTMLGASIRYFYERTYGFEAYWRTNLNYKYHTADGVTRDTYTKDAYGMTFYWNPAMNFSTHLYWTPRVQNIVFKDEKHLYQGKGDSWSVGFEYNF